MRILFYLNQIPHFCLRSSTPYCHIALLNCQVIIFLNFLVVARKAECILSHAVCTYVDKTVVFSKSEQLCYTFRKAAYKPAIVALDCGAYFCGKSMGLQDLVVLHAHYMFSMSTSWALFHQSISQEVMLHTFSRFFSLNVTGMFVCHLRLVLLVL